MKKCNKCKIIKEIDSFSKRTASLDGLQHSCKECRKKILKQSRQVWSSFLQEIKKTLKCINCEEREPSCLDFHHLDPLTKKFPISQLKNRKKETIVEEIEKCVSLCSNCHRKVHKGLVVVDEKDLIKISNPL